MAETSAVQNLAGHGQRPGLQPLDQRTTATGAQQALRRAILNGTFPPGSRLREARLAAQLGISRPPLREAFSRLEEEGLIVRVAYRGAFVAEVSEQTVAEIAELRFLVEPRAAERTAERLGHDMPAALSGLIQALRTAAETGDSLGAIEAHLAFHRFFYQQSGNELLFRTWIDWETRLRLFLAVYHQLYDDLAELVREHERLGRLVRVGHMDQFREELTRHVHKPPGWRAAARIQHLPRGAL
jgi:DNA-binding GntR family transcriptional regulator